ncbi:LysR family transcriptional regulator [Pediococcus acidilactici]|uniref:LysR family transcriptional regulator n=1 Tax=Pediococcus acidilactici TaxID=1254 RepID=UPI001FBBE5C8|nr:LysR family transcriptional regulator [Pediococcus acidilactici]MCJ2191995.1 LysR family transcriptional regulator [Pediococcus acidilactici]
MDTKKLTALVDLAETQSYSETAERLFLSQSTVSKHIMALEKEWDVKLFSRAHRQVQLTAAGKKILPAVQQLLRQEKELQTTVAIANANHAQTLVIHGIASIAQYQAFNIITKFTSQYPNVKLKFSEAEVPDLNEDLKRQDVDVIFTRIYEDNDPRYDTIVNETDHYVVLVPKNSPLAQAKQLSIEMIKDQQLLLLRNTITVANPLNEVLKRSLVTPRIVYEGQRIDLILEMLNQGMGVSVVMNKSFDLTGFDNVKAVPLVPEICSRLVFLKRRDRTAPVVNLFWDFAKREIEQAKE